jgi:hypothetical protein
MTKSLLTILGLLLVSVVLVSCKKSIQNTTSEFVEVANHPGIW